MTASKVELDIIDIFFRDITALLSINQIAKLLQKTYPHINATVNDLIAEGILTKVVVGRSYLCSINLDSDKAIALLSFKEAHQKEKLLQNISSKAIEQLKTVQRDFKIYTVFHAKKSLFFVLDHIYDKAAIKIRTKALRQLKFHFFSKEEFLEHIVYNQRLLKNKTVMYSSEKYYELLNSIKPKLVGEQLQ